MRNLVKLLYRINRLRWRATQPITVGVRLILLKDQTVLLVKHTYQCQWHWYLPGGGVKRGETLEEAARREVAEELGAELGDLHLFGVYTNFYEHKSDHVIVFTCDDFTLTGKTDREIESFSFFKLDDLPDGTSPGSKKRIQEYIGSDAPPFVGVW
jgi:ADP-ribose pyrophosphatase YjhB (NUDIX family)